MTTFAQSLMSCLVVLSGCVAMAGPPEVTVYPIGAAATSPMVYADGCPTNATGCYVPVIGYVQPVYQGHPSPYSRPALPYVAEIRYVQPVYQAYPTVPLHPGYAGPCNGSLAGCYVSETQFVQPVYLVPAPVYLSPAYAGTCGASGSGCFVPDARYGQPGYIGHPRR